MYDELKKKAEKSLNKKPEIGEDIDLNKYRHDAPEYEYDPNLTKVLDEKEKENLETIGIDIKRNTRAGSFIQTDHSVVQCNVKQEGIEILPMKEALEKYDWLKDYWWKAVSVDTDKFTAEAELHFDNGYFIRAKKGVKTKFPLQTCLYISTDNLAQHVHNIIIAEEDAQLDIISGCATSHKVNSALHVGITEFYVKKGSKITFTMIHRWGDNIEVRPRSGTIVEDEGVFISNYISFEKAKSLQMNPVTYLNGKGATAIFSSIVFAPEGSNIDLGSRIFLNGERSKAEIISRTVSNGGNVIARGQLVGKAKDIKAHLECNGLMLKNNGYINAIPILEAHHSEVNMSHEAAVGKIAQEEIEYLMARGLTEEEATSIIVRGFLNVKIEGLPPRLEQQIENSLNDLQDKFF